MLPDWCSTLDGLRSQIRAAFEARDSWFLVTALGVDEESAVQAADEIALIADYEGSLAGLRLLDLGCGVGRHLRAAAAQGARVAGVDASRLLADLAKRTVPDAFIDVADIHAVHDSAEYDIVLVMSDTLTLGRSHQALEALLRAARSYLRDNGLLVAVISKPLKTTIQREWGPRHGLSATESTSLFEASKGVLGLAHSFDFRLNGSSYQFIESSLLLSAHEIGEVANASALRLEHVAEIDDQPGGELMLFFRAERGFNYLGHLTDFLESWSDPSHPRNASSGPATVTTSGRITHDECTSPGRGNSVSRHHFAFYDYIEPGIRPLLRAFVGGWNQISYSSCEGHLHPHAVRETYSEAYVGLVALNDEHAALLKSLIESMASQIDGSGLTCQVTVGDLLGPVGKVTAVNLHLRRLGDMPWDEYVQERRLIVDRLSAALVARTTGLRQ